jgi:hypothetical protein
VQIERIQNKWLWEHYHQERKRLHTKNSGTINEYKLFHGTRGTAPSLVYNGEVGFDMRFSNKGMWGTGIYFAVNASYSDGYASKEGNNKQFFLALVLTGLTHYCASDDSIRFDL